MKTVRLGDLIEYDGQAWKVYAELGDEVALRDVITGRIRRVKILTLLGDDSYLPDLDRTEKSLHDAGVLDRLPKAQRKQVEDLHRHIYQLLNGTFPDPDDPAPQDPRYRDDVPMTERVAAKAAELGKTERQVWRHVNAYREKGIVGLVDGRSLRTYGEHGRVDPAVVEIAQQVIEGETLRSTGSRGRAILQIRIAAEEQGLALPSERTMYRLVDKLAARKHTFGEAATRRSLDNQPDRPWGGVHAQVPGQIVEIDSSPLDVMAILPNGETGRPEVTGAIDLATRTVLSAVITPSSTKAVDAGLVLARALTPPGDQPGWAESLAWARAILPEGSLPSEEEYIEQWANRPHIVPESITTDRGNVYRSQAFYNGCEHLQISIVSAASRTPTDKPHIERYFGTVNTGFVQYLKGYTGRSVSTKGKDPTTEALWTVEQLQNLLDWWIVSAYHQSPHSELRHPSLPGRNLSPLQMYQTLHGMAPRPRALLKREDYLHLLPTKLVTIQNDGITMNKLRYKSKELRPHIGRRSGLTGRAGGRKWEAKYDPYRIRQIYLHNHFDNTWITCRWLDGENVPEFSQETLKAALKALDNVKNPAGGDVLREIIRIQTQLELTKQERRSLRKQHATPHPAHEPEPEETEPTDVPGEEASEQPRRRTPKSMPVLDP